MASRQFTTPMIIRDGKAIELLRVPFSDRGFDEARLRQLLFDHPTLLPVDAMEVAFNGAIPIARELRTAAGPVDLILINPDGMIVLVETKLWRNPEARRLAVVQIIDYAKEIAKWT